MTLTDLRKKLAILGVYPWAAEIKTYQFEIDNFKKGVTAPANVTVGTAPVVNGMKFTAITQRLGFTYMVPLDWDSTTDMQFMVMCAITSGSTLNVGDKINLQVECRVSVGFGGSKLDDAGGISDITTPLGSSPFSEFGRDDTIIAGKNTEFYTYMPTVILPKTDLVGPGRVFYGQLSLKSIAAGNVPEIIVYQMHVNYFSKKPSWP